MAAKKILLLIESDRFTFPLLRYLTDHAKIYDWKIRIGLMTAPLVADKIRNEAFAPQLEFIDIKKFPECEQLIRKSDLVIAMVNDSLLLQIADSCIAQRKSLISPARLTRQMALKKASAKENDVLILMDCGLAPGLDHIIAKKAIDNIHYKGGKITSFKTYSGTFVSQTYAPNPWDFKLAEPAAEVLAWGKNNNRYIVDGRLQHVPSHRLFERSESRQIDGFENIVAIPEGDSLYYKKIYNLTDAQTVVKGKLLRRGVDRMWHLLHKLGMMDPSLKIDMTGDKSPADIVESLLPLSASGSIEERFMDYTGASIEEVDKLKWLGLFDGDVSVANLQEATPLSLLHLMFEEKLRPLPEDRDCLIMEHHLSYQMRDESQELTATLVLRGDNEKDSAVAKVIGYTCGAAAKSILSGLVKVKGLHIPIVREIYDPILNELEEAGIAFHITEKKMQTAE